MAPSGEGELSWWFDDGVLYLAPLRQPREVTTTPKSPKRVGRSTQDFRHGVSPRKWSPAEVPDPFRKADEPLTPSEGRGVGDDACAEAG